MRGFQPRSAAGAKEQRFADGGFVQGIKRAFGMDEDRNAQIAAYRARAAAEKAQQQAQAQQQTPQPQQRAVTQYSGMSATQRREKELGLADGGRVRPRGFVSGKGTGTSDSIPAQLSNGEYVLPADTVRAVGVDKLDALREATHKPVKGEVAKAARGFFAGGTPGGLDEAYKNWQSKKQPWYMPTPRGNMEERIAEANYSQALRNQFAPKPTAPAPTTTQNATDVRLAAGTVASPGAMAAARGSATPPKPAAAPVSMTGAPQQRAGQAQPFDFDTFEPAPGEGAFRNEQTGEVTRLQTVPSGTQIWKPQQQAPAAPAGFAPPSQRQGVRAPVLNPNGGVFSSMVDFTNQAGQAVQAIAANKGMRNDRKDALDQQRVGLEAASTFAKIEQGDRALGIDGRRADTAQDLAALQADELGLKREAAGFQTRAAQRRESAYDNYSKAKTDEDRQAIAKQFPDLFGQAKDAAHRMEVVRGKTDPMTGQSSGDYVVVQDPKTGEVRQIQMGAASAAPTQAMPKPASKAEFDALPKGTRFTDPNGQVRIK